MEGISLKDSVLGAGWCLVDSCLSLNRKEVTSTELVFMSKLMEVTNYSCLLQKVYKQILLNIPITLLKEIKPHTSGHMPSFFQRDSSPKVYNTINVEGSHKTKVKEIFRHSSKRHNGAAGLLLELFDRLNTSKLLKRANVEYQRINNMEPVLCRKQTRDGHVISIETEAGIVFECSTFSSDRCRLKFIKNSDIWMLGTSSTECDFLNPICGLNYLLEQMNTEETLKTSLEAVKRNEPGIKLKRHNKNVFYIILM
jgi:hypothetical protein